jgi:hypothetical protein
MTHEEALKITRVIAAAYEQSWKPSEEAIAVYVEILAVPEIDYDIARQVVIGMLRTPERFAPVAGAIYARAAELTAKREQERQKAELSELAVSIAQAAPRLEDGRLNYDWMYEELDRRRPELVLPRCAFDHDYAWTNAEIRANSRQDEFRMAIVDAAKDVERRLRLPPPAPNPRIASIVSEVTGRMGQAKPMTREEQEARVALIQKQAYELTRNGKVA